MTENKIEEHDHFRRAQQKAKEERLRRAVEAEAGAHRALAGLYGQCLSDLAGAEDLAERLHEAHERTKGIALKHKTRSRYLSILLLLLVAACSTLVATEVVTFS
ncbi:MAG: hypothetical protein AAFX39_17590 [Pseudomonadota bacterium]